MSVTGGMNDMGDEYADYRYQAVSFNVTTNPTNIGINGAIDEVVEIEPLADRLDSDEVAELVTMYRQGDAKVFDEAPEDEQEAGDAICEVGFGINLSEQEFLEQSANNNPNQVNPSVSGGTISGATFEEAGILDSFSVTPGPGYVGAAQGGATHGQNFGNLERFMQWRETYGTGPFVDITDDLTFHLEIDLRNVTSSRVQLATQYLLAWRTYEDPEGRARFGRR